MTPFDWSKVEPGDEVNVVQLGKYGDLINLLPVFKTIHERTGKPPWVMTHKGFADLFDGVSYARPFVTSAVDYADAVHQARSMWKHVMVPQGFMAGGKAICRSYQQDQWRYAGLLDQLGKNSPKFDQRDSARERELIERVDWSKSVILLALGGAVTSPFGWEKEITLMLKNAFAEVNFVDLCSFRTERLYDLLGLFDRAIMLFTCDTSIYHLSFSSGIKVALFQPDFPNPWLASVPYRKVAFYCSYRDCVSRIAKWLQYCSAPNLPIKRSKMFHVVARKEWTGETKRRVDVAESSWNELYRQGVIRHHVSKFIRTCEDVGEPGDKPFLKAILASAMHNASKDDIIVLTNDDSVLHPATADAIFAKMQLTPVCCSWRSDFLPDEKLFTVDRWSAGRDLFAFRKSWLLEHWSDIPDYVFGVGDWDFYFAMKFRHSLGIRFHKDWHCELNPRIDLPRGYLFHEVHHPEWRKQNNSPALRYNRWQTAKWITKHGVKHCQVPNDI